MFDLLQRKTSQSVEGDSLFHYFDHCALDSQSRLSIIQNGQLLIEEVVEHMLGGDWGDVVEHVRRRSGNGPVGLLYQLQRSGMVWHSDSNEVGACSEFFWNDLFSLENHGQRTRPEVLREQIENDSLELGHLDQVKGLCLFGNVHDEGICEGSLLHFEHLQTGLQV